MEKNTSQIVVPNKFTYDSIELAIKNTVKLRSNSLLTEEEKSEFEELFRFFRRFAKHMFENGEFIEYDRDEDSDCKSKILKISEEKISLEANIDLSSLSSRYTISFEGQSEQGESEIEISDILKQTFKKVLEAEKNLYIKRNKKETNEKKNKFLEEFVECTIEKYRHPKGFILLGDCITFDLCKKDGIVHKNKNNLEFANCNLDSTIFKQINKDNLPERFDIKSSLDGSYASKKICFKNDSGEEVEIFNDGATNLNNFLCEKYYKNEELDLKQMNNDGLFLGALPSNLKKTNIYANNKPCFTYDKLFIDFMFDGNSIYKNIKHLGMYAKDVASILRLSIMNKLTGINKNNDKKLLLEAKAYIEKLNKEKEDKKEKGLTICPL